MDINRHEKYVDIHGPILKLNAQIESQASEGNSGNPPNEVAGYISVIIDNIKYKIPIYSD